ncbi:MAG: aminotransferase class V-fold PLP-dependent enzyme, partial [Planctomycetes bacterium]|nr:aminotransferase class V-fold PLP-dependent enzyme [Planctomycetota bacterium]
MRRREFLQIAAAAAAPALVPARAAAALAALASDERDPAEAARDEDLWFDVQRAFTVDRSLVNLNNGGVSPAPAMVQDAMVRHLAYSNELPAYTMWRVLEPQREAVRQRLARHWKVDPEEIALTRNASESLQICQFGRDLAPGDEVLTTTMDYPRMITTFEQRVRREGIVLKQIELPVPC